MKQSHSQSVFCNLMCAFISFMFILLFASVLNDARAGRIIKGASLSTSSNGTSPYWLVPFKSNPYWLSPSGNIAFGFYQLPWSPNRYIVGIWFVKSSHRTLVWTANRNDLPLDKPCSILFTKERNLVLRISGRKDKLLLPDVAGPVSYAKMHDNGNFVLYGLDSQVIWESFDHPSDTILGGQKLKLGVDDYLISNSGEYKLSLGQTDGAVIISSVYNSELQTKVSRKHNLVLETDLHSVHWYRPQRPATLNLDTTGMLYLVDSYGAVHEIVYENKDQRRKLDEENGTSGNVKEDYIYRATLDSRGDLKLYKERIDGNVKGISPTKVLIWSSDWLPHHRRVRTRRGSY